MTSTVMSFGSQLSNGRTGSSHDTSVEVCEEECAHVSLSESLVEVQIMLVLFTKMWVFWVLCYRDTPPQNGNSQMCCILLSFFR